MTGLRTTRKDREHTGRTAVSTEITGILFAIGTATLFGLGSTVARLGLIGTPVVTGTIISMLAGTVLLLAVAAPQYPVKLSAIEPSGWALIVFTSVINYPIGRLMLFNAMRRIGVARGNTIVSANPVVAGTIAIVWLGEVLGLQSGVGMAACIGGGVLVAWAARQGPSADASALAEDPRLAETTRGIVTALGAMLSYGTVSALVKKIVTDITDPITAASLVFSFGTAMVAVLSLPRLRGDLPQDLVPARMAARAGRFRHVARHPAVLQRRKPCPHHGGRSRGGTRAHHRHPLFAGYRPTFRVGGQAHPGGCGSSRRGRGAHRHIVLTHRTAVAPSLPTGYPRARPLLCRERGYTLTPTLSLRERDQSGNRSEP